MGASFVRRQVFYFGPKMLTHLPGDGAPCCCLNPLVEYCLYVGWNCEF